MKRRWYRTIHAGLRDIHVLFQESWPALFLFVAILVGEALLFHRLYTSPGTDRHPDFGNARYAVFSLIFFNHTLEFPEPWYLQILYYLIPVLGLAPVVDGVLRVGVALVSKRDRGQ